MKGMSCSIDALFAATFVMVAIIIAGSYMVNVENYYDLFKFAAGILAQLALFSFILWIHEKYEPLPLEVAVAAIFVTVVVGIVTVVLGASFAAGFVLSFLASIAFVVVYVLVYTVCRTTKNK